MTGFIWPGSGVRPTQRCLVDDLLIHIPSIDEPLERIEHSIIEKAQQVPDSVLAGRVEPILSILDRQWLKVKSQGWRGAAICLGASSDAPRASEIEWWLGAAGRRQGDTPNRDFYAQFEATCIAHAKRDPGRPTTKPTDSEHFLPRDWDNRRLKAEQAYWANELICLRVRQLAKASLGNGHVFAMTMEGWELKVCIRGDGPSGAEAYVLISGAGITSPELFALILSAIPGVSVEDWMSEPSPLLDMNPQPGELAWSALLSPESQNALLDLPE